MSCHDLPYKFFVSFKDSVRHLCCLSWKLRCLLENSATVNKITKILWYYRSVPRRPSNGIGNIAEAVCAIPKPILSDICRWRNFEN